jgi:hypothetical protein
MNRTDIWVVVSPAGVYFAGLCEGEDAAWQIALGWPDAEEIAERKAAGWYAAKATATWTRQAARVEKTTGN